mgnify:CR=1 FL=1
MRIAIALGDPNGIGPEVAIKAALATKGNVRPLLVGAQAVGDLAHHLAHHRVDRGQLDRPGPVVDVERADTDACNNAGLMAAVISASGAHSPLSGEELLLRIHEALRPALRFGR